MPGQSGPGNNGNEGVVCIPQSPCITGTSPSDCLASYPGHSLGGGLTPLQRCSSYILQPQPTGQFILVGKTYLTRGLYFENNDEVIYVVKEFVEDQDAIFFHDVIAILKHCWNKYVHVKENYIEKWQKTVLFLKLLQGVA